MVLAVVLSAVWGTVGYNVWAELNSGEDEEPGVEPLPGSGMAVEGTYRYEANVRDPFRYSVPQHTAKTGIAARSDSIIWVPPPFRLCAIIGTGTGRSAVLEDQRGQVFVLGEGDTLSQLRVTKISGREVYYSYIGKKEKWNLE
jgi:hypothetical protein